MKKEATLLPLLALLTIAFSAAACSTESEKSSSDSKVTQPAAEDTSSQIQTTEQRSQTPPIINQAEHRQSQIDWLVQQAQNPNLGRDPRAIENLVQTARSLNSQPSDLYQSYFGSLPQGNAQRDPLIQSIIQNALEIDKNGANQQNIDSIIQNGQQLNQGQTAPGQAPPPNSTYDWRKWLP